MKRVAWFLGPILLASVAVAQQRPISQTYARDILDAKTIAIVAYSASAAQDSQENQRARLEVQTAMQKWGKYQVVSEGDPNADLIMLVRKGHTAAGTINGTTPPVVFGPTDSGTNIGIHHGQYPPLGRNDPSMPRSQPRLGSEVGSGEDLLGGYLGRTPLPGDARNPTQYPLDDPPAWSYAAADELKSPKIEAVAQFRKAVEAAEKKGP